MQSVSTRDCLEFPCPVIQRMEASRGNGSGQFDSLLKLIAALGSADEMIIEGAVNNSQERGVLKINSGSARTDLDYQTEIKFLAGEFRASAMCAA